MNFYFKCKIARILHHIFAFIFFIPISYLTFCLSNIYYNPIELKWILIRKDKCECEDDFYTKPEISEIIGGILVFTLTILMGIPIIVALFVQFPLLAIGMIGTILFIFGAFKIGKWIIKYSKEYDENKSYFKSINEAHKL